jgi:Tol biopolymer transport system component
VRFWAACLLVAVALGGTAAPAAAQFPGQNGRVALAWLDSDRGAHEEAAWEIISVPWRTGAGRPNHVAACTKVDGCPSQYGHPAYSPDGKRIVYTATALNPPTPAAAGDSQLTLAKADGSQPTVITSGALDSYDASFLPSGARLIFVRSRQPASDTGVDPEGQLVTADLTGAGVTPLGGLRGSAPGVSPDGRHILFTHRGAVWIADVRGGHAYRLIAHGSKADFSPDGRTILYLSGAPLSGRHILFAARLDGSHRHAVMGRLKGQSHVAPIANVDDATFSPDGGQIAFAKRDPAAGDPELFRVPAGGGAIHRLWQAIGLDAGGLNLGLAWQPR